jgi:hypothetical protein
MKLFEELVYKEEKYSLILSEEDEIFLPSLFSLKRIWSNFSELDYIATYTIDNYKLLLQSIIVPDNESSPIIRGVKPLKLKSDSFNQDYLEYQSLLEPLSYSGGIVIAKDILWNSEEEICPCYCYQSVIELIFVNGTLVTSIDHSKAMIKIRKNIDKGLRDIHKKRDAKCINRFIKDSLVGEYAQSFRCSKIKQLKKKIGKAIFR